MPPVITAVFDGQIASVTPTYTQWFLNCDFLVFQAPDKGEYIATGEFIEVAVTLWVQISPAGSIGSIERVIDAFQNTIDTIDMIFLPKEFRNDCFPMRLSINPSTGFQARILAISC
jgi:hypothetical protein